MTDRSNRLMRPDSKTGLTACKAGLTFFPTENTKLVMAAQNYNTAEVIIFLEDHFIDCQQNSICINVRHFTFSCILMMSCAIKMPKVSF